MDGKPAEDNGLRAAPGELRIVPTGDPSCDQWTETQLAALRRLILEPREPTDLPDSNN